MFDKTVLIFNFCGCRDIFWSPFQMTSPRVTSYFPSIILLLLHHQMQIIHNSQSISNLFPSVLRLWETIKARCGEKMCFKICFPGNVSTFKLILKEFAASLAHRFRILHQGEDTVYV